MSAVTELLNRQLQPINGPWTPTIPLYELTEKDPRVRRMLHQHKRSLIECHGHFSESDKQKRLQIYARSIMTDNSLNKSRPDLIIEMTESIPS